MTSNVGARMASELGNGVGFVEGGSSSKRAIMEKQLKKRFTPEFLNRIDKIVYFNELSDDNLKNIVKLELNKFNKRLEELHYSITYSDDVVTCIHAQTSKEKNLGARPIIRIIQDGIEDKITELMLANDYEADYVFSATCDNGDIVIN